MRIHFFLCALVLCLVPLACSSEPLVFPDWTIPVPEGTPIIEYAAVPMEERTEQIELIEDLAIGEASEHASPPFYRAGRVAVAPDGRMYVLDTAERNIKCFDAAGRVLGVFGHEGQGPGELSRGTRDLTIAGSRIIVSDHSNAKLSMWTLDGKHLGDIGVAEGRVGPYAGFGEIAGFEDGSFAGVYTDRSSPEGDPHKIFVHVSEEAQVISQYSDMPSRYVYGHVGGRRRMVPAPHGSPQFAASRQGRVYVTPGAEYQLLALSEGGDVRWALRVSSRCERLPREAVENALEALRSASRAMGKDDSMGRSDVDWPDCLPSIRAIRVDGHGHIYVFPYVYGPSRPKVGERRPVDVYSSDGERMFSGWIEGRFTTVLDLPSVSWSTSQGDYVYGIEEDSATRDQKLVRYRLVEPF